MIKEFFSKIDWKTAKKATCHSLAFMAATIIQFLVFQALVHWFDCDPTNTLIVWVSMLFAYRWSDRDIQDEIRREDKLEAFNKLTVTVYNLVLHMDKTYVRKDGIEHDGTWELEEVEPSSNN